MIDKFKKFTWNSPIILIIILDYFNIWIPRFCYHKKLSSSGNCRMCLVEVKGSLKPLIACCTLFNKNMIVYTNTELIRKSREYIMEFLLINHPLDCPICDQAGECDLQDLSLVYGSDDSRFKYTKKAILNKNVGSLIKTNMNRCIYCTRCVRYTSELNNVYIFNTLGRGGYSEISNYFATDYNSNYIDGNVIDLCPVGALTSKPYLFRNRTWELTSFESIDILDSLCSNIRIDTINNVVERILPKPNNNINEEWITDKIRFCYDGFKKQRLSLPLYKYSFVDIYKSHIIKKNIFIVSSWYLVFFKIKLYYNLYYNLKHNNSFFSVFTGNLCDTFSLYILKYSALTLGINNINTSIPKNIDLRKYYFFNNNIKSLDLNNVFLFLGTNIKTDSPILNLKIRNLKYKYNQKVKLCYIGNKVLLNYSFIHLGINTNSLLLLLLGKSFFCKTINFFNNIIFFRSTTFKLSTNYSLLLDVLSYYLLKKNFIFNHLSLFASDISLYELGIVSFYYTKSNFIKNNDIKLCYLMGVDYNNFKLSENILTIYQGHHGNIGLQKASILLPSNTFIENNNFFINCEGRFFVANLVITKKKKITFNESIIYNLFNLFFFNIKNKYTLVKLFIFFFYRVPFFFTKYKTSVKIYFSLKTKILFFKNYYFSLINNYLNLDVISKASYYLSKLKMSSINF